MFIKNLFKRRKETMSTLDEVRKAYEDLSEDDKKSFHQSISDRVHESIAAQERADGNKDSQSAKDREHEALGMEHADGKGDVEELHEELKDRAQYNRDDKQEEKQKEHGEDIKELKRMFEDRFAKIEERLEKMTESKLDNAREKYGLSSKGGTETAKETYTDEDINKLLG